MKKVRIYLLYLLQLFVIGVFILVLMGDRIRTDQNDYFENEMFTENVKGIQLSSHQLEEEVDFDIPVQLDARYMVYRYLSCSDRACVRGVYGSCDVFEFSSMLEKGRFFNQDDFTNKTKTVVLGADMLTETVVHGAGRLYLYDNTEYEVIGVFSKQDTILDKAVFLNLTALDEQINQVSGIYYVDAKNPQTVSDVLQQIKADIGGRFTVADVEFEAMASRELGRYFTTLFVFCNISAVLCLVITTIFLVTGHRYSIAVRKLCGMMKGELFWYYGKIMLGIAVAAFILIVLTVKILTVAAPVSIFRSSKLDAEHYILTGLMLVGIALCATCYITHLGSKVDISSVLKDK